MNLPPKIQALMSQGASLISQQRDNFSKATAEESASKPPSRQSLRCLPVNPKTFDVTSPPRGVTISRKPAVNRTSAKTPQPPSDPVQGSPPGVLVPGLSPPPQSFELAEDATRLDHLAHEIEELGAFKSKIQGEWDSIAPTVQAVDQGYLKLKEANREEQEQLRALFLQQRVIQEHVRGLEECYEQKMAELERLSGGTSNESIGLRGERDAALQQVALGKAELIQITEKLLALTKSYAALEASAQAQAEEHAVRGAAWWWGEELLCAATKLATQGRSVRIGDKARSGCVCVELSAVKHHDGCRCHKVGRERERAPLVRMCWGRWSSS